MDDFDARRASLDLVTAFVNNNKLSAAELPTLLGDVFKAISGFEVQAGETVELTGKQAEIVAEPEAAPAPETEPAATQAASLKPPKTKASTPKPAPKASASNTPVVSIEESLADPNVIVSLITGEKFKMLRRHLPKHGLTEAEYRVRFNLPDDYPMVAPAYAALRRDMATRMHASAKDAGAGSKPAEAPAPAVTEEVAKPVQPKAVPRKSASKKKVASPKKAAGASAAPVNAADAVPAPAETPNADPAPASEAESTPQAEPVKAANTPKKAAAKKPAPKRRMARQPAAETTSADATATPAPVEASEATPAAASAAAKPTKGRSRKSSGGAAMSEDGAKTKLARKERKTLTPAYR